MGRAEKILNEIQPFVDKLKDDPPIDEIVVDNFFLRKAKKGKVLSTDGDTLKTLSGGSSAFGFTPRKGREIIKWENGSLKILISKTDNAVEKVLFKYMQKTFPKRVAQMLKALLAFRGF